MTNDRFVEIVEDRCTKIKLILANKAKEYAVGDDRLYNFKRAAEIARCTPIQALYGMMLKHVVSSIDIIENADKGILPSEALLEEKFGDFVNYLILGEAVIKELLDEEARQKAFKRDTVGEINKMREGMGLEMIQVHVPADPVILGVDLAAGAEGKDGFLTGVTSAKT